MSNLDQQITDQLAALNALGMEMDLKDVTPFHDEAEKAEFLDQLKVLEELASQEMLIESMPASLEALTPLITAVFPASMADARDAALKVLAGEEAKDADAFADQGLYQAYDLAFAANNLAMSIPLNEEVDEVARRTNAALTAHGLPLISAEEIGTRKTLTREATSPEDYIDQLWTALSDLLPPKGLTLLDLRPIDGSWSICALIFIPSDAAEDWDMTGFGDYMLEMLLGEDFDEDE